MISMVRICNIMYKTDKTWPLPTPESLTMAMTLSIVNNISTTNAANNNGVD